MPAEQAVVPLNSLEYSYGFGVYETIRAQEGRALFINEHCDRLLVSARIIGLAHHYNTEQVKQWVRELVERFDKPTCNVKLLLIGGSEPQLYITCHNPLFPDRKLYKTGAHCITYQYEREFPQAKTLNMLSSYLAYKQAKAAGAYDALLLDRQNNLVEGTRSNFFVIKNKTIISPPVDRILPGVTSRHVTQVARDHGFTVQAADIPLGSLAAYDGAFLTSTSAKIMPVTSIDDHRWPEVPAELQILMRIFDEFLSTARG